MDPQEGALSSRGRGVNTSPEEAILLEMALDPVITGFPGDESDSLVDNLLNISIVLILIPSEDEEIPIL